MAFLTTSALWLCVLANLAAAQSGIFEVDLVFPRNGTWSPSSITPIVFAVQQPQLGALVQSGMIQWTLRQYGNSSDAAGTYGQINFKPNSPSSNSYLATGYTNFTSGIEDDWVFRWQFSTRNCSLITPDNALTSFTSSSQGRSVAFRTSKSAPALNMDMALSLESCGDSRNIAYNVTAIQTPPATDINSPIPSACAVLGVPALVTGTPCAVTIDAAASSSASAAISYSACQATSTSCVSPSATTKPSAGHRLSSGKSISWAFLGFVGLMFM
jgi:hypothetical protein